MAVPKIGRPRAPGEEIDWLKRSAQLRDPKTRNTSGLLRGDSALRNHRESKNKRASERLAERRAKVEVMLAERVASLPPAMSKSPIVVDSIRNLSRVQIILDGILDDIDRDVDNDSTDSLIKAAGDLYAKVKSGHDDLLSKWPKDSDVPNVQRIPASVLEWINGEDGKPIEAVSG